MPKPNGIIALLTDFGRSDPFVGIMHGVIHSQFRKATIVDLAHEVPAQDTLVAGFWLARSYRWFPEGTVCVCVVDPTVGSERSVIVAAASGYWFVAPDNGVLQQVLEHVDSPQVRKLELERYARPESKTFHGRDVFAPLAAELAQGELDFEDIGPVCRPVQIDLPNPSKQGSSLLGQVLFVDHFGNAITNLAPDTDRGMVEVCSHRLRVVGTYADLEPGECAGLRSSFETLEIAQRNGNAASTLGISAGAAVSFKQS